MVKGRSTKGRQRIEMKRIKGEEARQVCFSKRRPSLFKKASELSTLCGAEVAVVAFSPGNKGFSFGHPSTSSVANRFLAYYYGGHTMGSGSHVSQGLIGTSQELNQQAMELQQLLETEKKRKERLIEALERESGGRVMPLLSANVGELGIHELEELRKELCKVQDIVKERSRDVLHDAMQRGLPPQSRGHVVAMPSQGLSDGQTAGTMYATPPSLSNGPREELIHNSLLQGSLGGHENYFNGQFGG